MKKISLPKIGIRPVIDGRRMGVRESLEAQTMNMAKATAALISEKLRHACGARVECVIADTCIAGMAESCGEVIVYAWMDRRRENSEKPYGTRLGAGQAVSARLVGK